MPELVVAGAMLKCKMAMPPGTTALITNPNNMPQTCAGRPVATIYDNTPFQNIPPFGLCNSKTNPAVIALTAAASGAHTPAPCVPQVTAPWSPGSPVVKVNGMPALHKGCFTMCQWGGQITIENAGQMQTKID